MSLVRIKLDHSHLVKWPWNSPPLSSDKNTRKVAGGCICSKSQYFHSLIHWHWGRVWVTMSLLNIDIQHKTISTEKKICGTRYTFLYIHFLDMLHVYDWFHCNNTNTCRSLLKYLKIKEFIV